MEKDSVKEQKKLFDPRPKSLSFLEVLDPLLFVKISNKKKKNSEMAPTVDGITGYFALALD